MLLDMKTSGKFLQDILDHGSHPFEDADDFLLCDFSISLHEKVK